MYKAVAHCFVRFIPYSPFLLERPLSIKLVSLDNASTLAETSLSEPSLTVSLGIAPTFLHSLTWYCTHVFLLSQPSSSNTSILHRYLLFLSFLSVLLLVQVNLVCYRPQYRIDTLSTPPKTFLMHRPRDCLDTCA